MNRAIRTRERPAFLVAGAVLALLAVPAAVASPAKPSGLVATSLGSQDPRDTARSENAAGLVPSRLGSPDPRDTARKPNAAPGRVASRLGSPDPHDVAVASLPAELRGPVYPDGPTLRAAFTTLAAQAASGRLQASTAARPERGSAGGDFSWRDAGVGGGITLFLLALVGLAFVVTTHGRKTMRA